jgi:hypothetical protein
MASKGKKAGNGTTEAAGVDAAVALAGLGTVVGIAGDLDVEQGQDALEVAQRLEIHSDVVDALSSNDLQRSMDLGAIAGQIAVAAEIVYSIQMPELAAFLRDKSDELHDLAVEGVERYGAGRVLADEMLAASNEIGALGANEMLEGMARQEVADAALAASDEMVAGE